MQYVLIITIALFVFGLFLKRIFKNICVLCFAVTGSWIVIVLVGVILKVQLEPAALAIYMGSSATGFLYFLSAKLEEKYHIFKLPFLLTLLSAVYFFMSGLNKDVIFILFLLWLLFSALFIFRNYPKLRNLASKIIECCRNW